MAEHPNSAGRYLYCYCGQVTATHLKIWHPYISWWRHQMETFSALLAICAGNSPVPGEFPAQRPVTRSFDVFFDLHLNKRLSKQSWGWWFEMQSRPLWCHHNISNKLLGLDSMAGYQDYSLMHCEMELLDPSHKSHNALDKYPTMLHFITEMCTRAHFCYKMVHCGIWGWCIVGFSQKICWVTCHVGVMSK